MSWLNSERELLSILQPGRVCVGLGKKLGSVAEFIEATLFQSRCFRDLLLRV
jgi:hypothetical protein